MYLYYIFLDFNMFITLGNLYFLTCILIINYKLQVLQVTDAITVLHITYNTTCVLLG